MLKDDKRASLVQETHLLIWLLHTHQIPYLLLLPRYDRKREYAYYKHMFGDRPMPFALLDLDLLQQNIRQVVPLVQGKRVRIASKSLWSVAVIPRILEADACF